MSSGGAYPITQCGVINFTLSLWKMVPNSPKVTEKKRDRNGSNPMQTKELTIELVAKGSP